MKELNERRGGPGHFTVLFLVVIGMTGGVLLYSSMTGSLSLITTLFYPQVLSVDLVKFVNSSTCVVYLNNVGSEAVVVDEAFINDMPASMVDQVIISPNSVVAVRIHSTFVLGTMYDFKLVGYDSTQIVFKAEANF